MIEYEILLTGTPLLSGDEIYVAATDSWQPIHAETPFAVNGIYRRVKVSAVECAPVTPDNIEMKTCDFTGEDHPADEMTEYQGVGLVWDGAESKFREEYAECSVTDAWYRRAEMVTTYEGDLICKKEYEENWFTCDHSGEVFPQDEMATVYLNSGSERSVAGSVRDNHYRLCAHHDEFYPRANGHRVAGDYGNGNEWISDHARCNGPFFRCEECDFVHHDDDYDDNNRCRECSGESSSSDSDDDDADTTIIQSYDSTAYPPPIGDPKERYYGVENEVEMKGDAPRSKADMASNVIKVIGRDFAIIKGDGSLNNGFEIVTAPATMKIHAERWRKLCTPGAGDARVGLKSARTDTCGLHVHVSRTDFKSPLQLNRVQVFVNEPSHRGFIEGIARRSETSWCLLRKKNLGMRRHDDTEKYVSVNCLHSNTVEFRIFKGTLTFAHFMSSIQFIDALMDYTLPGSISFAELTVGKFCEFVKNNRKHWPHLTNELVRLGYLPKEAKVKVELKAADGSTIPGTDEPMPDAVTPSRLTPAAVYSGHLAPEGSSGLLCSVSTLKAEPVESLWCRPAIPRIFSRTTQPAAVEESRSPYADIGRNPTQVEFETRIVLQPTDIRRRGDWLVPPGSEDPSGVWVGDSVGRAVGSSRVLRYSSILDMLRRNSSYQPFADRSISDAPPTAEELPFMRSLSDGEIINRGDYLLDNLQWADGLVNLTYREGDHGAPLRFDPALVWARAAVPRIATSTAEDLADFSNIPLAS